MEKELDIALLVDDRRDYLEGFKAEYSDCFKAWDCEILTLDDVNKVRKLLNSKKGKRVKLVIIDILLPNHQAGLKLLSYVKKRFPQVRRIAITGLAKTQHVGEIAVGQLADGYIEKKWSEKQIKREIKRVLEMPCDVVTHSKITEAIQRWLELNPKARNEKIQFLEPGRPPMAIKDILREIESGTALGKRMERIFFQMVFDFWAEK